MADVADLAERQWSGGGSRRCPILLSKQPHAPHVYIKKVEAKGRGVVAAREGIPARIKVATFSLGPACATAAEALRNCRFDYVIWVQGKYHPIRPCLAALVNTRTDGGRFNCRIKGTSIVTTCRIPAGEELTVSYHDMAFLRRIRNESSTVDTGCRICNGIDRPDQVLLCDFCDGEFHFACVGLPGVPEGSWKCPGCLPPRARKGTADLIGFRVNPPAFIKCRGGTVASFSEEEGYTLEFDDGTVLPGVTPDQIIQLYPTAPDQRMICLPSHIEVRYICKRRGTFVAAKSRRQAVKKQRRGRGGKFA